MALLSAEFYRDSRFSEGQVKSGDVIYQCNGKQLDQTFAEFHSRIATTRPGTKWKLGLLRDGKPLEVEVTLDSIPLLHASAGNDRPGVARPQR